jgi:hypothetical protein
MPPKYEYKTVMLKDPLGDLLHTSPPPLLRDAETILNNCGNDGWELVSAYCSGRYNHHYYFKRELQQEPHVTQVDETEVNTDEILSGMNKLKVDTEPPAPPKPDAFTFGTSGTSAGSFTFGTSGTSAQTPNGFTFVNAAMALKADQTAVNLKANTTDVNTAMALKADKTAVDTAFALKADRRDLDDCRRDFNDLRRKVGRLCERCSVDISSRNKTHLHCRKCWGILYNDESEY